LNREVVVAIPTFVFALKTKSIGFTVLIGMALYWLLGRFPVLYVMKIYG
jgi:branched-subunit amino acid transport protein